jgi:hypothetical protein
MLRSLTRFSIAALIGVGATLSWQSYGDAAKEMVIARAPTLAWLLSISTTKPPVVATTSPDPMQQLAPLASNLDVVRRSVEQLAAKQEQMAQNIAALQAVEEDIRQKLSSTPPPPGPAGGLHPAAQTSATQGAIIGRTVIVGASPAACRRTTALALTARIAGGEIDQRLSFCDPVNLWRPTLAPQFTSSFILRGYHRAHATSVALSSATVASNSGCVPSLLLGHV